MPNSAVARVVNFHLNFECGIEQNFHGNFLLFASSHLALTFNFQFIVSEIWFELKHASCLCHLTRTNDQFPTSDFLQCACTKNFERSHKWNFYEYFHTSRPRIENENVLYILWCSGIIMQKVWYVLANSAWHAIVIYQNNVETNKLWKIF